ncbi:MAG: MFS transporter [Pseudomonadota bacterium]
MIVIVVAGGLILALSFGLRSVFGGFVEPLSQDLFDGQIAVFSLSLALQNLIWGVAQPVFGMLADKYGDRRALWTGFLCYGAGMALVVYGASPATMHLGAGLLVGMGIAGTAFGLVLAVVGRAAPVDKRDTYLGITSALGSAGQVVMPLLAAALTDWLDWRMALTILMLLLLPMALCIPLLRLEEPAPAAAAPPAPPLMQTIANAFQQPSYVFLCAGFFVCGFHVAFISAHLPTYVQYFCSGTTMTPEELRGWGLQALSVVGLANIFGTLLASRLGTVFPKPYVLASIYGLRAVVILVFISAPLTPTSVMVFAAMMGVLWLSTVPLTSALVLTMFGPRAMATLFGFVFLSHQLGGFIGVWWAGQRFDLYADYDLVWQVSILLGIASAALHLMVRDGPAPMHSAPA